MANSQRCNENPPWSWPKREATTYRHSICRGFRRRTRVAGKQTHARLNQRAWLHRWRHAGRRHRRCGHRAGRSASRAPLFRQRRDRRLRFSLPRTGTRHRRDQWSLRDPHDLPRRSLRTRRGSLLLLIKRACPRCASPNHWKICPSSKERSLLMPKFRGPPPTILTARALKFCGEKPRKLAGRSRIS